MMYIERQYGVSTNRNLMHHIQTDVLQSIILDLQIKVAELGMIFKQKHIPTSKGC